jgi:uncharacterized protein
MDPIYLPQLETAPDKTEMLQVQITWVDLPSLIPVTGWVKVVHQGTFLEVSTEATTIVTLCCDRCLQQYNHRLATQATEMIWLEEAQELEYRPGEEIEVPLEQLVETLSPEGYFHPGDWLYQQLCLELPMQKLCDQNCAGLLSEDSGAEPEIDRRWAGLDALRNRS